MNPLKLFLPDALHRRRVLSGLLKGLTLDLNLRSEFLIWLGCYERETFIHIKRLSEGAVSAIDIGAAKGDLTIWLLKHPSIQKVVAVEPLDREIGQLKRNLSYNDLSEDNRLSLVHGFVKAAIGQSAEQPTLDELAQGLDGPIFVKIDIDGPESDVLAAGKTLLANVDSRWLIETHSAEAEDGCLRQFSAAGFQTTIINPAWWRIILPERRPLPHNRWLAAWRS